MSRVWRVRPPDAGFRLPDDASAVTDADLLARAAEGPDWGCDQCGTSNSARQTSCQQCGAPRGSAARSPEPQQFTALTPARRALPKRLIIGSVSVVLAVLLALVWLFSSHTENASGPEQALAAGAPHRADQDDDGGRLVRGRSRPVPAIWATGSSRMCTQLSPSMVPRRIRSRSIATNRSTPQVSIPD
jgi:hypothetical protein